MMKSFRRNSNGITLIALVITIIVLLILAAVSIATLTGNNGLLAISQKAKDENKQAENAEKEKLGNIEDIINEYSTGIKIEQVTDENPGVLEIDENNSNTYIINSIEDLIFFAYDVTKGNTYNGKTVKLGLSLDFKSNKSYKDPFRTDYSEYGYNGELKTLLTSQQGFIPIGISNNISQDLYSFSGTFDGNGQIIYNLYINKNINDSINDLRLGFFCNNYGTINEIGLINCNIIGNLENNISSNSAIVGGIVGYNYGNINDCFISGNIHGVGSNSAKARLGGITGSVNNGSIKNCYNMADLLIDGNSEAHIGGIVGYILTKGEILNCYNMGKLTSNITKGSFSSGGIAGWATSSANLLMNNCYNIGEINSSGNAQISYIGGIVGHGRIFNINNCYSNCYFNLNTLISDSYYIGQIAGTIEGNITYSGYFSTQNYDSVGRIEGNGIDESKKIENEYDMPNILNIVGDAFKNSSYNYPILNWQ